MRNIRCIIIISHDSYMGLCIIMAMIPKQFIKAESLHFSHAHFRLFHSICLKIWVPLNISMEKIAKYHKYYKIIS